MTLIRLVITPSGEMGIFYQPGEGPGTFAEGKDAIIDVLNLLVSAGIEMDKPANELAADIEQHRHDGTETVHHHHVHFDGTSHG